MGFGLLESYRVGVLECGRADWALERRNDLVLEGWRVVWEVSAWVREKFIKQRLLRNITVWFLS